MVGVVCGVGAKFRKDAGAIRADESKVFPIGGEFEAGVEFVAIGGAAIFTGGEDEKVAVPGNRDVWELPLGELVRVIGEVVSIETDRSSVGIVKFDPVRGFAIFVLKAGGVGVGEEFVNAK